VDSVLCFLSFICWIAIYLVDSVIHPYNRVAILGVTLQYTVVGHKKVSCCPQFESCFINLAITSKEADLLSNINISFSTVVILPYKGKRMRKICQHITLHNLSLKKDNKKQMQRNNKPVIWCFGWW